MPNCYSRRCRGRHFNVTTAELSRLQLRLALWQRNDGTARVVFAITAFSVIVSALVCYPIILFAAGSPASAVDAVGVAGLVLPVLTPMLIAPAASYQLATAFGMASALIDELESARTELQDEVVRRAASQAELERLARHDPLTGVLNRRGFFDALRQLPAEQLGALVLVTVDVDQFKEVNDSCGHAIGDQVLCAVAATLSITAGNDALVARLGGDEFAIGLVHGEAALITIREALRSLSVHRADADPLVVRCSVGVAEHTAELSIDATLARADAALYVDKPRSRDSARPVSRNHRTAVRVEP